ncbi:MAG: DNA-binding transcriptional ArsR family regulator [Polaribacter sp.]|jgi:DNA-binding transcriptional ArsR family regulator
MNIETMQKNAAEVSALMKTLSNTNRLMVLCQLTEGERSVGELAEMLEIRMPAMSQQLNLLRLEKIVESRRDGQTIYYSLAREDIKKMITFLYTTYCNPLS